MKKERILSVADEARIMMLLEIWKEVKGEEDPIKAATKVVAKITDIAEDILKRAKLPE